MKDEKSRLWNDKWLQDYLNEHGWMEAWKDYLKTQSPRPKKEEKPSPVIYSYAPKD